MDETILDRVRTSRPIVHSITNYVTANDCANILLACGASPIMSDDPAEAEDIASLSSAVVLNLGTLSDRKLRAMLIAGQTANTLSRPVILDPVGAGSSRHRTAAAKELLANVKLTVIRGNVSEIRALAEDADGAHSPSGGVDAAACDTSVSDENFHIALAKKFASDIGAVVVMSGAADIITDGKKTALVRNGHCMMRFVTGTGCQLSSLTAAFEAAAKENGAFDAAVAAVAAMGLAGEVAARRLPPDGGSGTYRAYIIDAIYNMTSDELMKGAKYEIRT